MPSSSFPLLLWSFICFHLLGFSASFQQRLAHSTRVAFRTSEDRSKYQHSPTCLKANENANDVQWNVRYEELAEFHQKHGHLKVEYESSIYTWMKTQRQKRRGKKGRSPLTEKQIQLLDDVHFNWSSKRSSSERDWITKYEELAEFQKEHGHLRVNYQTALYRWIVTQRGKRADKVGYAPHTEEQIQLLDEIDFEWVSPISQGMSTEKLWSVHYEELAEFHKKHGHLGVETRGSLDQWVITQRRKRKGMKGYAPLTEEQIHLLDEIDFIWIPKRGGVNEKAWVAKYEELNEFYNKHGHFMMAPEASTYGLSDWIRLQRKRRKGMKGCAPLAVEQIRLLDEIDFPWGYIPIAWMTKYGELAEFYKNHDGRLNVVLDSAPSLYRWIVSQRRRRKGSKGQKPLSEEQIQLLDEINFPWEPVAIGWMTKYEELVELYKKNGHLMPEYKSPLYTWMGRQRVRRSDNVKDLAPLTEDQIKLLDQIDFPWEPTRARGQGLKSG